MIIQRSWITIYQFSWHRYISTNTHIPHAYKVFEEQLQRLPKPVFWKLPIPEAKAKPATHLI